MVESEGLFDRISMHINQGRIAESLDILEEHYRQERKFPELFEVLKSRIRFRLGLPLIYRGGPEPLTAEQQQQLETELLRACQEVGTAMLDEGQIAQGWVYLQPLSDQDLVRSLIEQVDVHDDNVDEIIEIALGQGAAPAFGFQLLLERQGTCNAITFFDTQLFAQPESVRRSLAGLLVNHIYRETCRNVRHCIHERERSVNAVDEDQLPALIKNRRWLFDQCGHHLDVTHLVSVLRIARICDERDVLTRALQMAEYGCQLDDQLRLPGEPPFRQPFKDHRLFFQALLGIETEAALQHFARQAESAKVEIDGPACRHVLMELLHRTGNAKRAIDQAMCLRDQMDELEFSDLLMQLADDSTAIDRIICHFRDQGTPLHFALALIRKHQQPTKKTRLENQAGSTM